VEVGEIFETEVENQQEVTADRCGTEEHFAQLQKGRTLWENYDAEMLK
jgi:hypothetical protein